MGGLENATYSIEGLCLDFENAAISYALKEENIPISEGEIQVQKVSPIDSPRSFKHRAMTTLGGLKCVLLDSEGLKARILARKVDRILDHVSDSMDENLWLDDWIRSIWLAD